MHKVVVLLIATAILLPSCSKKGEIITDISQLKTKRICILTGSAGDRAARQAFPGATFLEPIGSVEAALAVKTRKADAYVYDRSILEKIVAKNPDLKILEPSIASLELAIAFKKDNLALVSKINSALSKLRGSGELDRLKKKWVDASYSQVPPVPVQRSTGKNGTLKMGTNAIFEPYTFVSNGKMAGYDIELAALIGDLLDMKIDIVEMAFDGLIPALQGDKIDFALSDFTVTEERKKSIAYSDPYIQNDISALVRGE